MDNQLLWRSVLADLEIQLTKPIFKTFLSQTELLSLENSTATIGCSPPIFINLVETRYHDLIKKTLDQYCRLDTKLVFVAKPDREKRAAEGPLFTLRLPEETVGIPKYVKFNPDYTFENFAVSSSNQMAYAAATAVAKSPGTSYSPLFLYGGSGVGKTHLMQAIGHSVLNNKPKTKILYCTSEEFTNEIIEAIGNKTTTTFKKKYRQLEILLIDDVQFIAGKYSIQEEFFHTFNAIQQNKGQVILTSDRPPEEINKLETRLKSRFEGGLTIDIGPADFELRTAILLIKSKKRGVDLPIEVAKLIAANIENPRKLEGVFVRIYSEAQTKNLPIDEELAKSILGKTIKEVPRKAKVAPEEMIGAVASYFQLKLTQIKGNKRDRMLSLPRQILYYLLNVELGVSLVEIGHLLGGRDHTTILHGVRKIVKLLSTDEKIYGDVMGIKNRIFG
jgi:chromosomal replication initiator protein